MSLTIESIELNKFYTEWMQEIAATQQADEEGANSEQIFTQNAIDLLTEAGEVENARLAYDEKALGTSKQHKINAYAISENYETIDLFISIFKGNEEITKTNNDEVETASKRISNFFRKAIYSNDNEKSRIYRTEYVEEIEETSEIFQFANTLGKEKELRENLVRINATILTNGLYNGEFPDNIEISGYKIYFKVFDLEALYNVSEKSHLPNEINFYQEGFEIPCIASPTENLEYQSYLAILPGLALAKIYEKYGSRLLEQNIRSFLMFTGKINGGIRKTIQTEPQMFLAYNNGISATANEVEFVKSKNGTGMFLSSVKDLQIVNGGQTTASIYHTWKKDKADISNVFVQVKLSVVKRNDNFSTIVSRISEYANTQNKVSIADLSSNRPYHIEFEKLSRSIFTPISDSRNIQTKWFYERARGQYKNARLNESLPKSRLKAFDLKTPKNQLLTKETLAKFLNTFHIPKEGEKNIIGPYFVARGDTKNFIEFSKRITLTKLNNIYFEDTIAKAILFRTAEKVYFENKDKFIKLRYVTVPYSLAYLNYITNCEIDFYKIWKNQSISRELKNLILEIMLKIENFIINNASPQQPPEWAKKEECWLQVKAHKFNFDISTIKHDFIDKKNAAKRHIITEEETNQNQSKEEYEKLKTIPYGIWKKIEEFGYESKIFTDYQCSIIFNIASRIRTSGRISENEKNIGLKVLETIIEKVPELLFELDNIVEEEIPIKFESPEMNMELIKKMVVWEKKNKKLKDHHYMLLVNILEGKQKLTDLNKKYCLLNLKTLRIFGFKE